MLRDEERLHEERTKALLARDRLMHAGGDSPNKYGFSSSGRSSYPIGYPGSSYFEKSTLPLPSSTSMLKWGIILPLDAVILSYLYRLIFLLF
ncbi:unnamed protein product [Trichobilharzia regenti]|nr:unnamed protein product [Trichobilharzia regenti]